jgi:hypothetical protein
MSGYSIHHKEEKLIQSMALFFEKRKESRCTRLNGELPPKQRKQMDSILAQAAAILKAKEAK